MFETCRVLFQKQISEISASSWFYYKNTIWSKHVDFYSKNKFQKLVHLVGFIIGIVE